MITSETSDGALFGLCIVVFPVMIWVGRKTWQLIRWLFSRSK